MTNIKVLGTGCTNCKTTLKLIQDAANAAGVEVELEKIEEMPEIMSYGIMSTPGVVVDGEVVHSGGIPSKDSINEWIKGNNGGCCSGDSSSSGCCG